MLISTSRKPSQNTRKFCKNLMHATGSEYINRGKSSIRDILLKSTTLGNDSTAFVYEIKGNPSKITFFSRAEKVLSILVTVKTQNTRLHMNPKNLKVKCEVDELAVIADLLDAELDDNPSENYLYIHKYTEEDEKEYIEKDYVDYKIGIIDFYNKNGEKIDFQIAVRKILDN
ncbi:ribonucleotide-diphosphate reductase subunit beta [Methanobrevibacter boviskoreani]|jgi:U3 small nucleolar ribonucleoprotein protein IMP4|uniref:ribonucleotide-diphosphate reductase subunit beta n=1 Tax=Methanobrevibacter boviskoreani TaxID=1348249 RepID=UPI0023A89E3B|nr:ribonucleotide-diphosphate reductase subunit beta [Methanobrevibacter boviskoreani]MCI6774955.1 ribonucleotide-diphosphate reductase subunit beta [Methanobrevibacter boviskoreani]MCI6931003.1 ribonucleotide-diphosphate reductase subunit beta [Methanobrevibacter boviskoreani]MDD6257304.1 ribonucleotide-diphosphate reductase subunit beta [Methanobrevibacter boviskoreani]MDY5613750.1 ribonucleotide-diphosphate reductase subunit beta [Methanobrevibacter boviskoreani]